MAIPRKANRRVNYRETASMTCPACLGDFEFAVPTHPRYRKVRTLCPSCETKVNLDIFSGNAEIVGPNRYQEAKDARDLYRAETLAELINAKKCE